MGIKSQIRAVRRAWRRSTMGIKCLILGVFLFQLCFGFAAAMLFLVGIEFIQKPHLATALTGILAIFGSALIYFVIFITDIMLIKGGEENDVH